ncbi:MAG: prepilin-type N-terminal cleavage/methylation domain-containing protein [Desulfomonilia bacterium]
MNRKGFTLVEVLIAMVILSITFMWLLKATNQSIDMASRAKFITTATLLAQRHISEVQAETRLPGNDEGDFGEDFPGYRYTGRVEPTPLAGYHKYVLTITWGKKGNLETQFIAFLSSK